ncbi:hypothetical protein BDP55DRAFT_211019 [Colletotrichum godetiae]|uniref:Uncharacterized protein n=1 Tax=Colletotrichum godetiae TaxID=1209918 RepID=A0AAJ0AX37_9PEZI|nr:uncharacterized protein BDP55DRAFT_211019 [Colletotrichum godetiae]KAK1699909.1 hypothetical protein BDP55DRAFT_211019 [Colletotrichum godetiae]
MFRASAVVSYVWQTHHAPADFAPLFRSLTREKRRPHAVGNDVGVRRGSGEIGGHPADVNDVPAGRILQRRSYTPSASASFLFGFGMWGLSHSLAGPFSSSTGSSCCCSISPFTRASSQSFILLLPLGSSQSRHVIIRTLQYVQNHGLLSDGMRIKPPPPKGFLINDVAGGRTGDWKFRKGFRQGSRPRPPAARFFMASKVCTMLGRLCRRGRQALASCRPTSQGR